MINPLSFENENLNIRYNFDRGTLSNVSIADIHFGCKMEPELQYKILKEQFIDRLYNSRIDIVSILGDLFDKKLLSNSDSVLYAIKFINDLVDCARVMGFSILIISGTASHDANQYKLFYHLLEDQTIDFRIVEKTRFEYVKNAKILCIPEEYGMSDEYYNQFLNQPYDIVFMHGLLQGAIPVIQNQKSGVNSLKARIFTPNDFKFCRTCVISGHVHIPGCYNYNQYYVGSPYSWVCGEDVNKGFVVSLHNLDTGWHYMNYEFIISPRYITVTLDQLSSSPKEIIDYINDISLQENIGFVRIELLNEPVEDELGNLEVIKSYFKNNNNIKFKIKSNIKKVKEQKAQELSDELKEYEFIFDEARPKEEILVEYINKKKGYEYITIGELNDLLNEK